MNSLPKREFDIGDQPDKYDNSDRFSQLDDDVRRIASTLASLSSELAAAVCLLNSQKTGQAPVRTEVVRAAIRARRLRSRYFATDLFADPAWDMMLELLLAELMQLRIPVSALCDAAAVPATTALRWQKLMVERGLLVRKADPHDARRVFVELAPETSHALRCYFAYVDADADMRSAS